MRQRLALFATLVLGLVSVVGLAQTSPTKNGHRPPGLRGTLVPAGTNTLPSGTVLVLRMETRLNSKTSRIGDRFTARLIEPVYDQNWQVVVPDGCTVEGHVESASSAQLRRRAGVIGVQFDRLILTDGRSLPLDGVLTSVDARERKKVDSEGNVVGGSTAKRTVVLVGGGAASGAAVGAITGGPLLGASIGAAAGAVSAMIAKGKEATVDPGMQVGLEILRPVDLGLGASGIARVDNRVHPDQPVNHDVIFEPDRPDRNERVELKRSKSAPAPRPPTPRDTDTPVSSVPPVLDDNRSQPADSGVSEPVRTDPATSAASPTSSRPDDAAGQITPTQTDALTVRVSAVIAERTSNGDVRILITAETPTAGWRIFVDHSVDRDTLEVWLRGYKPSGPVAQVLSHPTVSLSVPDQSGAIHRILVHGSNGNRTAEVAPSTILRDDALGDVRARVVDKLEVLAADYAASVGAIRDSQGRYQQATDRQLSPGQVSLLSALSDLVQSARSFQQVSMGQSGSGAQRQAALRLSDTANHMNGLWVSVRPAKDLDDKWHVLQDEIRLTTAAASQQAK
jgi:hypothetical protein